MVNKRLPRTFGDGLVHISHFDALVNENRELPEHKEHILSAEEKQIGKLIAENLVHDGATLQMGKILVICVTIFLVTYVRIQVFFFAFVTDFFLFSINTFFTFNQNYLFKNKKWHFLDVI